MSEIDERLAGIAGALGIWLIVIAVLLPNVVQTESAFAFRNYLIVGAAIAVLSAYTWVASERELPGQSLAALATIPLGLWLIALPFYTTATTTGWLPWNDLIIGVAVIWIGVRNTMQSLDLSFGVGPSTS